MIAMLLAAGMGRRMQPLTLTTSKVLLEVAGRPLIEHHILRLRDAGVLDVVINLHHFGDQIEARLGDGAGLGVRIRYSREPTLLETGGGISAALPLLGQEQFLVVSADIYTDYPLERLLQVELGRDLAHLVMVPNPPFHPQGDFGLAPGSPRLRISYDHFPRRTWGCMAVMRPEFVAGVNGREMPLRPLLDKATMAGLMSGELYEGYWANPGTPEQLERLRRERH